MSLLDDVRAAGLDVRMTRDGRLQIRGPGAVQDRLRDAIRRQAGALGLLLLAEEHGLCCRQGPIGCDHVWCEHHRGWANDTGWGASCCPGRSSADEL